jgi:hypothetical protein
MTDAADHVHHPQNEPLNHDRGKQKKKKKTTATATFRLQGGFIILGMAQGTLPAAARLLLIKALPTATATKKAQKREHISKFLQSATHKIKQQMFLIHEMCRSVDQ